MAPGLGVSQAAHLFCSALLEIMQISQVQVPAAADVNLANRSSGLEVAGSEPGLGVSQATHLDLSGLFEIMQASQVQSPDTGLNLANKSLTGSEGFPPGLGVSQAAHFSCSDLFEIIQTSQVQDPAAGLNRELMSALESFSGSVSFSPFSVKLSSALEFELPKTNPPKGRTGLEATGFAPPNTKLPKLFEELPKLFDELPKLFDELPKLLEELPKLMKRNQKFIRHLTVLCGRD